MEDSRMARYEQIRVLGEGSFGKVYLMRQRDERQLVCVKVIKIKNIPRKEREACKMEVDLLRRLNHPNIVGYRESFVHSNKESLCIVMQVCRCHCVTLALR
jgi:serine/threonine protein kinase